jgi:hypothetical protein
MNKHKVAEDDTNTEQEYGARNKRWQDHREGYWYCLDVQLVLPMFTMTLSTNCVTYLHAYG